MGQPERGSPMGGVEAYTPAEIARMVETKGVTKAGGAFFPTFVLGVLAGAFIAFGAVLSTIVGTGSELGFGPTRWLAGLAFSLGLILVVVAGAELFTGNNLVVMSLVDGHITVTQLMRNWAIVFAGNFVGAISVVVMVWMARGWELGGSEVGVSALSIAATKTALPFEVVFVRGILCNVLVCLAVWLAMAGKTLVDKVFAIIFPIAAFVAAGFEHSVANMYFIPQGMLLKNESNLGGSALEAGLRPEQLASLDWGGLVNNIAAATLGNVIGGGLLVGLVYWFVYLRPARASEE
ncbi:MAG: formate/nitrite transporter family protein [Candidatus Nanopelagicales bacterium]|jgi:formate/nitrite transporter|nr:formate/nitrite transporter family protein [Candidatus Nanopelagicales bacterium]